MPRKIPPLSHSTLETPLALSQLHIRLQFLEKSQGLYRREDHYQRISWWPTNSALLR